jgi:acyl carrier protein
MSATTLQTVRQFITDNFLFRGEGKTLADDTSFLETGLIDSTGVLELVAFLEETFRFKIADDEIIPDNLDSLKKITAYVERKQAQARPASGAA